MKNMIKVKYTPVEGPASVPHARFWDKSGHKKTVNGLPQEDGSIDYYIHDNDQNRTFFAGAIKYWTIVEDGVDEPVRVRMERAAPSEVEKTVNQMINDMVDGRFDFGGANTSERKIREMYQKFLALPKVEKSEDAEPEVESEKTGKKKGK